MERIKINVQTQLPKIFKATIFCYFNHEDVNESCIYKRHSDIIFSLIQYFFKESLILVLRL